jgi:hypothetical protein
VRKRLLVLAGVALAAAVIVLAALQHYTYRQKLARGRLIDQEHYDRIKTGMSRAEVEAVLGGPPGDFHTQGVLYLEDVLHVDPTGSMVVCGPPGDCVTGSVLYLDPPDSVVVRGERWEYWSGNEGQIAVAFDEQATVRGRDFRRGWRFPPPSLAEWLQGWLRRVWP